MLLLFFISTNVKHIDYLHFGPSIYFADRHRRLLWKQYLGSVDLLPFILIPNLIRSVVPTLLASHQSVNL